MQFTDYQLLQRNIRMKDFFSAAIVPGYIHFKAGEKRTGNWLLGLRMLAYTGLTTIYVKNKLRGESLLDLTNDNSQQLLQIGDEWELNVNDVLSFLSIGMIITTYMYDWLHGSSKMEYKQEMKRYKYGLKMSLEKEKRNGKIVPTAGFSIKF